MSGLGLDRHRFNIACERVWEERERQVAQGFDEYHDRRNTMNDWVATLVKHTGRLVHMKAPDGQALTDTLYRQAIIVAAIALAMAEALTREGEVHG